MLGLWRKRCSSDLTRVALAWCSTACGTGRRSCWARRSARRRPTSCRRVGVRLPARGWGAGLRHGAFPLLPLLLLLLLLRPLPACMRPKARCVVRVRPAYVQRARRPALSRCRPCAAAALKVLRRPAGRAGARSPGGVEGRREEWNAGGGAPGQGPGRGGGVRKCRSTHGLQRLGAGCTGPAHQMPNVVITCRACCCRGCSVARQPLGCRRHQWVLCCARMFKLMWASTPQPRSFASNTCIRSMLCS
jgi:hypothetical protein